jgi:hypothetical protein
VEKQLNDITIAPMEQPVPLRNRGWFQQNDSRINRQGRPKGSKLAAQRGGTLANLAPRTDRLMVLLVPARGLVWRLRRKLAPWITNLPEDVQVVGCHLDAARDSLVLVLRSKTFPRIAQGTLIPQFKPAHEGLRWRRPNS